MSVVLHEGAIRQFFHDETGELGIYLARKSNEIATTMHTYAQGHVRSGLMITGIRFVGIFQDHDTMYSLVGTDAKAPWRGHEPFSYPLALEYGGITPQGVRYGPYPFIAPALRQAGFRRG